MRKNEKRILDRQLLCVSFAGGSEGNESTGNAGLIPGSGRSLGDVNDNPLQYSCLENPMDRGAWRAAARGVTGLEMTECLSLQAWYVSPHPV